jgi:ATP adenylyltransferase
MTYINSADKADNPGCFFCQAWEDKGEESKHLLLLRRRNTLVMLNRYPYSNAHLMVAPARHFGVMEEAEPTEGGELWETAVLAKKALAAALKPDGFNLGINQGRVAGAGILDHLHLHLVPRWNGDVNFMPVLADTRVIPQALAETHALLLPFFKDLAGD